jgi:hypothetical protein
MYIFIYKGPTIMTIPRAYEDLNTALSVTPNLTSNHAVVSEIQ